MRFILGAVLFSLSLSTTTEATPLGPITCHVAVSASNAWNQSAWWLERVALFRDQAAEWISPTDPIYANGLYYVCPTVRQGDEYRYQSSFTVPQDGQFIVEFIADDAGEVTLTRAPSQQPVLKLATDGEYVSRSVQLPAGTYLINASLRDIFGGAAAIALSIQTTNGTVVKRSTNDATWTAGRLTP